MSTEHKKTVHRRYVEECWGDGDMDLQEQFIAEDVVDHDAFPGVPTGLEGRRIPLRMFGAAFDLNTNH